MYSNFVEIQYQNSHKKAIKVAAVWLRDHCRCSKCYDLRTKQRILHVLNIPSDIKAVAQSLKNETLLITWSDGHESKYDLNFILTSQLDNYRFMGKTVRLPWDTTSIQRSNYAKIDLSELINSDSSVKEAINSLLVHGLVFITKVPTENVDMTELAFRRLFPIMKTFYGEMYTFTDMPEHADNAYSSEYLGLHTDNTYFCDGAGVEMLHCLKHEGTGGESLLLDGLNAVEKLRAKNPKAYEILTQVQVPSEYIDADQARHHMHTAPIIRLNSITGEFEQIRWHIHDRSVFNTIDQKHMPEFYAAYAELMQIIEDDANKWVFKLTPGSVLIFDNWRLLHGRKKYTGLRNMASCYALRTEYLSKARHFNLV